MTLLFISREGDSLGLAMRCISEDFSIFFYTEDESASFVGNGIVTKPAFSKHLLSRSQECIASNVNQLLTEIKPDLVIVDGEGMGKVADYIKEQNIPVFGSSHWSDTISSNADYAGSVMKRVGIDRWKKEDGIHIEVGMWWNGIQFLSPFLVWNEDRFMTSSLGCRVESASNIISSLPFTSKLIGEGVGKMERLLKKSKFRGILSMECVVTKGKVYGISFTTSTLFLPSLLELYKGSVTELLLAVANGRKSDGEFTTDYALSLLLSTPPYPCPTNGYVKTAISGVSPFNLKHLYMVDVEKYGDSYGNAGVSGKLMWVSARGRDVGEAKKRVMKTISNLTITDVQYRVDSTTRISIEEKKLKLLLV
jgi:phosphoribosylamine-glycine ligase